MNPADFPVDRGTEEERTRWLAELKAAAEAQKFPAGGSLIYAESPAQAQAIAAEMIDNGHDAIVRGVYVLTTLVFRDEPPPPPPPPTCMHCGEPLEAHTPLPGGRDSACRDGKNTFNFEFQINPEVAEFVKANLDKPPEELTRLWIERVRANERRRRGEDR
ncbi:MAG TPA: hypothetical protein VLE97_11445 [Gaiellaceae bacterium]|nr:hypothetical protein [Gaiellaceae bacterium]